MHIVPISSIVIGTRTRALDPKHVGELKESILSLGNLHPPVFWLDRESGLWNLSVGAHRTAAVQRIAEEGKVYFANNEEIKPGFIGILELSEWLDAAGRLEAEIFENIQRKDLSWQDRCQALAALHAMRGKENPGQTMKATGEELVEKKNFTNPKAAADAVSRSKIVSQHLANPKIAKARNENEAYSLILKGQQEQIDAAIARRVMRENAEHPLIEIRHADLIEELKTLPEGFVDLILADPPYGIGAGGSGFRSRTVHHHNYDDTPEAAKEIALHILSEGFRIGKARANLFIFHDITNFNWLSQAALNMGWKPFPRPLIWGKSDSEGLAPWGGAGPRITTEFIFFATKGQRGLHSSPIDYLRYNRKGRTERLHAAEKPVELLTDLIKCATLPGDFVLDPCCGSGSTLVAVKETKRMGLGIEKDLDYYNTAIANVHSDIVKAAQ
jgi:site-specific DNA-methyltransferase (adenine-specific)